MPQFTTLDRESDYYEKIAASRNPKHDLHCMCPSCFKTPICCMVCQYEFRYVGDLVKHRTRTHEIKKGGQHAPIRQRVAKRELIPDGLGYLIKVFASEHRKNINTEELSKFSQHIADLQHTKKKNRTHHHMTAAKLRALKDEPDGKTQVLLTIPNQYLLPAYQIWEITGVQPNYILLALIAYGLEYLAKELRQYPVFPEVTQAPEKKLAAQKKVENDLPEAAAPTKPKARSKFF
jgi:hypothetical protein